MASDVLTPAVVCSYCLWRITEAAGERTTCPDCATVYHADCFEENGGCGTFGCAAWLAGQNGEEVPEPAAPVAVDPAAAASYCTSCGVGLDADQRFCTSCGASVQ